MEKKTKTRANKVELYDRNRDPDQRFWIRAATRIYWLLSAVFGIQVILEDSLLHGILVAISAYIGWFAGPGIRGSLHGTNVERLAGVALGCGFIAVAQALASFSAVPIGLPGVSTTAAVWSAFGTLIGFSFVTKHMLLAE